MLSSLVGSRLVRTGVNLGYHAYVRRRLRAIDRLDFPAVQAKTLHRLIRRARDTRFGRDHHFDRLKSVDDFARAVPLRTYEQLWNDYLREHYPILYNVTWPGRVPYLALTSGTTQGATKYIPVTRAMLASNTRAARSMLCAHMAARPDSRLFHGRIFFLGGSSDLERPATGVIQGDLSGIAARALNPMWRPYTFPPLQLALEPDWDRKLDRLAERSRALPITLVSGVPSWLLVLFRRLLDLTGKATVAEVWPTLEVVVHGGVKFEPYRDAFCEILGDPRIRLQETYPCSEGFIAYGDPATGLLRLCVDHGIFYEFVPVEELGAGKPERHWLGTAQTGVNYAIVVSTCAGLWAHVIGDTVRFESLDPPLLTFTGRTKYTLSAFGEHLISEEVEAAVAAASAETGAAVRDWHVGPVFDRTPGRHLYVAEFLRAPGDVRGFRDALDDDLRRRNADYAAHRVEGAGIPRPALLVCRPGGLDAWMRGRGKLGGQHKFPRMDGEGRLTAELVGFLRDRDLIAEAVDFA